MSNMHFIGTPSAKEPGIDIYSLLSVFVKNLRILVFAPILMSILITASVYLFVVPTYISTVKIVLPTLPQSMGDKTVDVVGFRGIAGGSLLVDPTGGLRHTVAAYVNLLSSNRARDAIIQRTGLDKLYYKMNRNEVRSILGDMVAVRNTGVGWGLLAIRVEHADRLLAAKIANAYPEVLQELLVEYSNNEARLRQDYYAKQKVVINDRIKREEETLKLAGVSTDLLKLDQNISYGELLTLNTSISDLEVRLHSLSMYMSSNAPEYIMIQSELNALRTQLKLAENTKIANPYANLYPMGYRNYLVDVKLLENLSEQLELAKIDSNNEEFFIKVVDMAEPAARKNSPDLRKTMVVSGLATGVLILILIYLRFGIVLSRNVLTQ